MPTPGIAVHLNNSGGSDWLSSEDLRNLEDLGWTVHPWSFRDGASHVSIDAPEWLARSEFASITGQDPDARGCDCCGRPFRFYAVSDITDPYSEI